jgi:hypothetical protein
MAQPKGQLPTRLPYRPQAIESHCSHKPIVMRLENPRQGGFRWQPAAPHGPALVQSSRDRRADVRFKISVLTTFAFLDTHDRRGVAAGLSFAQLRSAASGRGPAGYGFKSGSRPGCEACAWRRWLHGAARLTSRRCASRQNLANLAPVLRGWVSEENGDIRSRQPSMCGPVFSNCDSRTETICIIKCRINQNATTISQDLLVERWPFESTKACADG